MKTLITTFILITALGFAAFAADNSQKVTDKKSCAELVERCIEIRQAVISEIEKQIEQDSDMLYMLPDYNEKKCIEDFVKTQKAGACTW